MTRAATPYEIADRERDYRKHEETPRDRERLAVAALIGECEAVVASGTLTEPAEQSLRVMIANTLAVFRMASKTERRHAQA